MIFLHIPIYRLDEENREIPGVASIQPGAVVAVLDGPAPDRCVVILGNGVQILGLMGREALLQNIIGIVQQVQRQQQQPSLVAPIIVPGGRARP